MQEIWKDIYLIENGVEYDYRCLYQVSSEGRVKSLNYLRTGKEKILSPGKTKNGYFLVALYKDGKQKMFRVHRLVAHMFIENDDPINKIEVNHIDENKTNNCVDNLEWCTKEYNNSYGTHNERMAKTKSRKIIGYSLTSTKIIILQSATEAKKFGFHQGKICACCNGKQKQHKGYRWYYLDDKEC